jgi:DNA-binding transcriptional MerR regulator
MEKSLPAIPAKRYFTIGEVSELCAVKPYVLRYWEQEFAQLRPMKRRGNRRYYQHHEVLLVRRIRELLYDHGFTISGARNRLAEMPIKPGDEAFGAPPEELADDETALDSTDRPDTELLPLAAVAGAARRPSLRSVSPAPASAALVRQGALAASTSVPLPTLELGPLRNELLSIRDLLDV